MSLLNGKVYESIGKMTPYEVGVMLNAFLAGILVKKGMDEEKALEFIKAFVKAFSVKLMRLEDE